MCDASAAISAFLLCPHCSYFQSLQQVNQLKGELVKMQVPTYVRHRTRLGTRAAQSRRGRPGCGHTRLRRVERTIAFVCVGPLRPTGRGPQAKGRGEANQARRPARAIQRVRRPCALSPADRRQSPTSAARQKPCRAASTNVRSRRGDCGVVRSSAVDCVGIRCKSRWGRRAPRRGRRAYSLCRRRRWTRRTTRWTSKSPR